MKHIKHIVLPILSCLLLGNSLNAQCGFTLSSNNTPTCADQNNGAIDLTVDNGTGPFTFSWSNGVIVSEDLQNLVAGTYTVTVTDAVACSQTIEATVIGLAAPAADAGVDQLLDCTQIQVILDGSSSSSGPNFVYLWTGPGINGSNSQVMNPTVQEPGSYTLMVTNATTGCSATDQVNVFQNITPPIVSIQPPPVLNCIQTTVTLDGTGSSGLDCGYNWWTSNGNIISGNSELVAIINAPGTYSLTVTRFSNGCTAVASVNVSQDIVIPIADAGPDFGSPCSGFEEMYLNGGGSPFGSEFEYQWIGPAVDPAYEFLRFPLIKQPGDYTIIVTNTINGCTATDQTTVFPGIRLPPQTFNVTDLPCAPGPLGAIDMDVNFGTPPHTFLWSNNATTADITNLVPGRYTITATDATGCSYHAHVDVSQVFSTIVLTTTVAPATCFGTSTGQIDLTAAQGMVPYSYHWEGPQGYTSTAEDITNLRSGNYSVTVTDAAGCTKTLLASVGNASPLEAPFNGINISQPSCNGYADGAINIITLGGTPPFTFDWSNDGLESPDNDSEDITGIPAGTYTVIITDANGCSLVPSAITLTEPSAMLISTSVTPSACGSGGDGTINLTLNGGTLPYQYFWSNGGTTQNINLLPPGTYTVTVVDANACSQTTSAVVLSGAVIPQGDFSVTPASCEFSAADGIIELNTLPTTAQSPLTFEWRNSSGIVGTTQNISGLAAGDYTLSISDINGCLFFATVTVGKIPGNLSITQGNILLNCTSNTMELLVSGGTGPYTYEWSDGSISEDLIFVAGGEYYVTVTDAVGCSKSANFTLTGPTPMSLVLDPVASSCSSSGNDGAVNLSVVDGFSPFTYLWSTGVTTQNLTNLPSGVYCVTVSGANGCTASACVIVEPGLTMTATMLNNSNPTCWESSDGAGIVILSNAGPAPYSWVLSGQSGVSPTTAFVIPGLGNGTYCVSITNGAGCTASACAQFTAPPPLEASIEVLSNTCNAAVLQANLSGGLAPFSYSWESAVTIVANTQVITAPVSGSYQVLVTDANGCGDFASITVDLANGGDCGYIKGSVLRDDNDNCLPNANEPGLAGWLLRAEGLDTLYGTTDVNGRFLIGVPVGNYTIAVLPPNNLWFVCPGAPLATVDMANDTAFGGDIPVKRIVNCPAMTVSISTPQLRRCFSNNYYSVFYCNEGTAAAQNAYVDITLDPFLTFISATVPTLDVSNNVRRCFLGNVDIGDCGAFSMRVSVSCAAVLGQTHCTEAHIFPDTLCNTNMLWSGASIGVRSTCSADSVRFVVKNVGNGNMSTTVNYIVVEDAVMLMQAPLPLLQAEDSVTVAFPANGSTWRMEVGQETNHPYPQPASLSVEGCTTNTSFSTGYVNQFPLNDAPPTVDVDCMTNIGSYDPNDKHGYPIGYGAAHYVRPGTEIEYLIRFQNTGTDTAFNVRVIDTLATWLDPASIKFGASSHPYRYDLCGEGIVHFIFDNIMLPDSNVNEPGSNGFAKFAVSPRVNVPLETDIYNTAAIYFDFNDPVFTNTTQHRIGENFIMVGLWQPQLPQIQVEAMPNPFDAETVLTVKGLQNKSGLQLQIFDYQGKMLHMLPSDDAIFRLKKGSWPSGIYLFNIIQNGKILGSGKLIAQ